MAGITITGKIRHVLEMLNEINECLGTLSVAEILDLDEAEWLGFLEERELEVGYNWDDIEKRLVVKLIAE